MLTPRKRTDKRLPRTADTELYERNGTQSRKMDVSGCEDVRQRIDFGETGKDSKPVGKMRVKTEGIVNQRQVEQQYRKTMLKFLDDKFSESYLHKQPKAINLQPPLKRKMEDLTRVSRVDPIKMLFRQYVQAMHKYKIVQMGEFNFGNILLHLGFVRNLVEERGVISRLWQMLTHPAVFCHFLYLAYVYCRIELKERRKELVEQILPFQSMFLEEGYRYTVEEISFFFQLAQGAGKSRQSSLILANRQNRATFSSLNRSLSRNHR